MTETQTLLIVDDCEADREVFREYLSTDPQVSYEIFEAEEAAEGLALCKEIQCDLILLDFRLPDMTGLEFLQQRQQQAGILPSVIMMTGEGCETIAVQAMKCGAENYLLKQDLEARSLIRAVRDAMRQRRLQVPQIVNPLPEAMAASVLRFRRSLDLEVVAEAAVAEIRHWARCDRASIIPSLPTSRKAGAYEPSLALAQAQSPQLTQLLPNAAARQRRGRGRPPKRLQLELTPIRIPILSPAQELPWGCLLLEYLPGTPLLSAEEAPAFEALAEQLAIAIDQAEEHRQALAQIQELQSKTGSKVDAVDEATIQSRKLLGNVLAAASTLVKHRAQLRHEQQAHLLQQIEDHSRMFVSLLEELSKELH